MIDRIELPAVTIAFARRIVLALQATTRYTGDAETETNCRAYAKEVDRLILCREEANRMEALEEAKKEAHRHALANGNGKAGGNPTLGSGV